MRVKSRWNVKGKDRSLAETGGALAFIMWRIAQNGVLHLENEGFQIDTYNQRLDVLAEFLAFLFHYTDRSVSEKLDAEGREELMTALARRLADNMQENRVDSEGQKDYRGEFISLLNRRTDDYAEFSLYEGEPGFAFRRYLGEKVTSVMGPQDSKWISDQMMDIEVPAAIKPLNKALGDLIAQANSGPGEDGPLSA